MDLHLSQHKIQLGIQPPSIVRDITWYLPLAIDALLSLQPQITSIRKTLRPSAATFRKFGWLPANNVVFLDFMKDLVARTCNKTYSTQVELLPAIKDFKKFIEDDPTVFQEFVRMFEGLDEEPLQVGCLQVSDASKTNSYPLFLIA